jgi:hypothetical protein
MRGPQPFQAVPGPFGPELFALDAADDTRRVPTNERVCGNVARDDRTRRYDGILANCHAADHSGAGRDPDPILDADWPPKEVGAPLRRPDRVP